MPPLDILILGCGWTGTHLLPLLKSQALTYAYTTRSGRGDSIPFTFNPAPDPSSDDDGKIEEEEEENYARLPSAKTVLVTFPIKGKGRSRRLVAGYERAHGDGRAVRWIQLGSTGIFTGAGWNDSSSPYDRSNERAVAEDELLSLCGTGAVVLDLAGLYDGETRRPRDWVGRVMRRKEDVEKKGSLHLVHGADVAKAIVGVLMLGDWEGVGGRRWIVTDLRVYDWWDLVMGWGGKGDGGEYRRWVVELMREGGVRALPREKGELGRVLDGRAFWEAIGCWPGEGRMT